MQSSKAILQANSSCLPALLPLLCRVLPGGFIKTVIRVLRCVGHYNSKILLDRVGRHILLLLLLLVIAWPGRVRLVLCTVEQATAAAADAAVCSDATGVVHSSCCRSSEPSMWLDSSAQLQGVKY
jgi:hypothetical protein